MRAWRSIVRTRVVESDAPSAAADAAWRPTIKGRVLIVAGAVGLWSVLILGRLVQLQVFQHQELRARADLQQHEIRTPPAGRGDILDRNGRLLAYSVDGASIEGYPHMVKDPAAAAHKVCEKLPGCTPAERAEIARRLGEHDRTWAVLRPASPLRPDQIAALRDLKLSAIGLFPQTLRYYPNLELAAHVIGFVGVENTGLGGVESRFNSEIRGRDGRVLVQRDARNREMFTRVEQAPTAGAAVELTIDLNYQHIVERELLAGIRTARAQAGSAIVMDPYTGEILALANYPTYNPNTPNETSPVTWRNRAVQEVYEPGSTFKIVTAAAALEEGVYSTTDLIDTNPGYVKFPGRPPIDEAKGHNYGVLTFEDVIVKSSNVGAIRAGLRVGAERMARFARRFGFGQQLAPDFSGESAGIVHSPARLNDSDLASMSMGYTVSVTPVQMAAAVSAVANGGLLYQPHIVRARIKDGVRTAVEPRVLRRAIAAATANTMTAIMEAVVERGTAKTAAVPGYRVAGKTGTAAKIVNGTYSQSDYNASFVGFAPSRRPAFTILVVVDTPRNGQYGGTVAAPIFRRIAEGLLQHAGIPTTVDPPPAVIVAGIAPRPRPAATALPTLQPASGRAVMPDVRGLGARDALRVLAAAGLDVAVSGTGVVVVQRPAPGEPLDPGTRGVLELQRVVPAAVAPAPPGGHR